MAKPKIGMLTGGGDCPGLNAVIRAVVRRSWPLGYQVLGFQDGWRGLIDNNYTVLDIHSVSGILPLGGTILKTSRTNLFKDSTSKGKALKNLSQHKLVGLIAIGGEDTLGVAAKLYRQYKVPVVGVPKTIDNDLPGTDQTFGFDTAVSIATEAIDRVHTTAESHKRVMVVEVMGRHAGWIATYAGIAGGADAILIPEKPFRIDDVCKIIHSRHDRGKEFSIVVVAEGAKILPDHKHQRSGLVLSSKMKDEFGHVKLGGVGNILAEEIEKRTGFETRVTILGHTQRGGSPTAFDRVLATRYGIHAMDLVHHRKFGRLVALKGKDIISQPLSVVTKKIKTIDPKLYGIAAAFFN